MGYAIFVIGPAGSGKTSLSHMLKEHYTAQKRGVVLVNLDPAQALTDLEFSFDIRDHIEITEIMEAADFGPNGGLMAGLEAISDNLDIMELPEDDDTLLIFDCPGQIELYLHSDSISKIITEVQKNHFPLILYALDVMHLLDSSRFTSAAITATIAMSKFEVPHLNIFTKCDLVKKEELDELLDELDLDTLCSSIPARCRNEKKFNHALTTIIKDEGLLGFIPLNYKEKESLDELAYHIDTSLQYFDSHMADE
ncbi:GPN-loop GTPase [Nematocida parisii]|nr:GPN-loop GTPase [Nematocida parisii]KAI5127160.1 GPN-loop GTPase [Nematocida parisii]KAI5140122.1 GPN-loop GTPase [Nematocida parisii]